jgi:hypothetical protein
MSTMATIVDKTACELAGQGQESGLLPASPFTALQYHFGMLLGVDDLETGQAYPRGKIRLHNAWLHREGVVWGLNVSFNERGELVVDRGLALDAAGHELHLDTQACLDLGQWYVAHKDDADFTFTDDGGSKKFTVHVIAKFKACLTRPVPAIVEPCAGVNAGVNGDTAYSRVFETIELLLRPGVYVPKDLGYHRLRVLFQIEPDSAPYADVQTTRQTIQALPIDQQPAAYLQALRQYAALDEIDLVPQAATATEPASVFPEDPTEIVLADIVDIEVQPTAGGDWAIVTPPPVPVVTVRPSHIATATIQELLCGPLFIGGGTATASTTAPTAPTAPATAATAPTTTAVLGDVARAPARGGPIVTAATLSPKSISLTVSREIAAASLEADAISVTDFDDDDGWSEIGIKAVATQANGTIKIDLKDAPAGDFVRLIVRGTGPTPLLSADDHVPLGSPGLGGADDGTDFVKMFKRS